MKAKSAQYQRAPGNNRRGKPASRPAETRSARKTKSAEASGSGMVRRLLLRRPIFALTFGLVVAGGLVGLFAGGHVAKGISRAEAAMAAPFTDAGFALREVTVLGGERTTPESASAALALAKGGSIFNVRPDAARARLLMLPWVADAEVQRHFPDTVMVHLIEKRPFALWKTGNELSVVERSGAVITKVQENLFGHLPVIAGAGAPEAAAPIIDALAKEKATQARLVALERVGDRRWDLHLAGGVTVRLPEEGWERQLLELEKLIIEKGVLERDIEMIDLRYPDNYVFRLHNGDSRPVPRERHA
jgi:cell division protein FtsQ